jgi:hypothetical protein
VISETNIGLNDEIGIEQMADDVVAEKSSAAKTVTRREHIARGTASAPAKLFALKLFKQTKAGIDRGSRDRATAIGRA